jgi:HEAT repeat protein
MTSATPERAALIVQAMADRPDTVDLADVLNAAEQGPQQVRISAIDALRRVGDVSCLSPLLAVAIADDAELALAAQETLAELPGQQVDDQIGVMLPSAKGPVYPLLVKLVGKRRIKSSVPDLLLALESSEKEIRGVAFIALGETVRLQRLSVLISQVITPDHSEDLPVARLALKTASVRMPDREACATELTMALKRSPVAVQGTLLEILGDVSGPTALKTIGKAAKSNEPQLQDTGSRLLGKWNNVEAAPVLLDLAKTAPANKYKVRALRGYLGLARKFSMPAEQRVEMCRNAFKATSRTAEHKLALDVLKIRSSVPGLKLAIEAMSIPGLKDDATDAVRVIAEKLEKRGQDVSELLSSAGLE